MENLSETLMMEGVGAAMASTSGDALFKRHAVASNASGMSDAEYLLFTEKLSKFKNGWVDYDRVSELTGVMERLIDWGNLGDASRSAARCILIYGPPGCGKTALLSRLTNRYRMYSTGSRFVTPVAYVSLPSDCSPKGLAVSILRALNVPGQIIARGNLESMTKQVEVHLKKQGVRLLILDEFHHLVKSGNTNVIYDASEYVKTLLNLRVCPIVMAGTEGARLVYRANKQIQRRSMGCFNLGEFNWSDANDREMLLDVLETFEANFPLPFEGVSLWAEGTAWRLCMLSEGNLGRIVDFLYLVAAKAFQKGIKAVGYDLLRSTAADMGGADDDWVNPFDVVETKVPIDNPERETRLHKRERQVKPTDIG
jgi:hypothetical protein